MLYTKRKWKILKCLLQELLRKNISESGGVTLFVLELKKLTRQKKISNCFFILIIAMILSLELTIFLQAQHRNQSLDNFQAYLQIFKKTAGTDSGTKKELKQRKKQYLALKENNGYQAQLLANDSMHLQNPWMSYSGESLMPNLHSGEAEATKKQLEYLKKNKIAANLPLTVVSNPMTELTNSIPADQLDFLAEIFKSSHTTGYGQIWFWASIGGAFILLAIINIFLGDILSIEWTDKTNHLAWMRLNGVRTSKLISLKFVVHYFTSLAVVSGATIVFLLYAKFRSGLGDLLYPVQNWHKGPNIVSQYSWGTASDDANFFSPFQIEFRPLSNYLLKFILFILVLLLLNSALTIAINYLIRNRIFSLSLMTFVPLLYFVIPQNTKTPFQFLNFDWLATGYLNYYYGTFDSLFGLTILTLIIIISAILLFVPIGLCLRKERKY